MKKQLVDLVVEPQVTMKEKIEVARKAIEGMLGDKAICVGFEFHFVANHTLASISGWTEGFSKDDYEE